LGVLQHTFRSLSLSLSPCPLILIILIATLDLSYPDHCINIRLWKFKVFLVILSISHQFLFTTTSPIRTLSVIQYKNPLYKVLDTLNFLSLLPLLSCYTFAQNKINQSFRILREQQALLRAHNHVWFVTSNANNTNGKTWNCNISATNWAVFAHLFRGWSPTPTPNLRFRVPRLSFPTTPKLIFLVIKFPTVFRELPLRVDERRKPT
jgi:hypothetical protein